MTGKKPYQELKVEVVKVIPEKHNTSKSKYLEFINQARALPNDVFLKVSNCTVSNTQRFRDYGSAYGVQIITRRIPDTALYDVYIKRK